MKTRNLSLTGSCRPRDGVYLSYACGYARAPCRAISPGSVRRRLPRNHQSDIAYYMRVFLRVSCVKSISFFYYTNVRSIPEYKRSVFFAIAIERAAVKAGLFCKEYMPANLIKVLCHTYHLFRLATKRTRHYLTPEYNQQPRL